MAYSIRTINYLASYSRIRRVRRRNVFRLALRPTIPEWTSRPPAAKGGLCYFPIAKRRSRPGVGGGWPILRPPRRSVVRRGFPGLLFEAPAEFAGPAGGRRCARAPEGRPRMRPHPAHVRPALRCTSASSNHRLSRPSRLPRRRRHPQQSEPHKKSRRPEAPVKP